MRIRTIKPEFFVHDRLYEAEAESGLPLRIAFAGLWCAADREGRFKWEPRRLGVQILPYDKVDFSRVLDALTTRGFILRYASGTGEFGYIPSFSRHQIVNNKERASELPEPILEADSNACPTREPRDDHACRKERKGTEHGKEQGTEGNDASDFSKAKLIEAIVTSYPGNGSRIEAQRALAGLNLSIPDLQVIKGQVSVFAEAFRKLPADEQRYLPGKERFFTDRRWEDDPNGQQWLPKAANGKPAKTPVHNRWNNPPS